MIKKYLPDDLKSTVQNNIVLCELPEGRISEICNMLWRNHKLPLKTITAVDDRAAAGVFKIVYVFGCPEQNIFIAPYIVLRDNDKFPSIARSIHAASLFERKIRTFYGLVPSGHPNMRPILLHGNWPADIYPLRKDFDGKTRPPEANGHYSFLEVEGEGIYEIPVGPVHAGIIEPGHFRFSVAGEEVLYLEPQLGFVHKGIEKLFETLSMSDKLRLSERVSGDSSFGHSLAFCQSIEAMAGIRVPERAQYLRVIYAELERIANHLGDIGLIMMDAGFSFGGAQGARLREIVMQLCGKLTHSRFLCGVNVYGGVSKDIGHDARKNLLGNLEILRKEFTEVIRVASKSYSLLNRLKGTGVLTAQIAKDHGVVGVAARANGIATDARIDHPYAAYNKLPLRISLEETGDVYARFMVRVKEVYSSLEILQKSLENLDIIKGDLHCADKDFLLPVNSCAIGVSEGWRGDIVYFVLTDSQGLITRVDIRDPSSLNWTVVPHAVRGNIVPDFPLINKSFNLSYSGNDL